MEAFVDEDSEILTQIRQLGEKLRQWQYDYYVLSRPVVSDLYYDQQFDLLLSLEFQQPQFVLPDSPTQRVGSDLSHEFPEVQHSIPVLSLNKAYSVAELIDWSRKTTNKTEDLNFSMVMEEKIDGISIVLYYEEGLLARAVTRGNGIVGNDVTFNVKTINSVPLRLKESITVAVRGEIYLPLSRFAELNSRQEVPYANPRNLAAGTIRRVKSRETAEVPLAIFCYEGFFQDDLQFKSHRQVLEKLGELGFRLNPKTAWFSTSSKEGFEPLSRLEDWVKQREEERSHLDYEIDGLVFKVNELPLRQSLGYTGHHPRWAIAYKFESPMGQSEVLSIDVQVGRTGRITPVARIAPVEISGSVVSNVTLHNQDYIDALELAPGDVVAVSKRGDVIPAVESVVEKGDCGVAWQMPTHCPSCDSLLEMDGAHLFCKNRECPHQRLGQLLFFVGRSQMDIDGLGEETIIFLFKEGLIGKISDLFTFSYERLVDYPGFGDKKVAAIQKGLLDGMKHPFSRILASLGIKDLGPKVCELLVDSGFSSVDELIATAKEGDSSAFEEIRGIGPITACGIVGSLTNLENLALIDELKQIGLNFAVRKEDERIQTSDWAGEIWCVTGSFANFKPRDLAGDEIKKRGGTLTSTVSGATTHLLAGEKAGSKLTKAQSLGVKIVNEEEFLALLEETDKKMEGTRDETGQHTLF